MYRMFQLLRTQKIFGDAIPSWIEHWRCFAHRGRDRVCGRCCRCDRGCLQIPLTWGKSSRHEGDLVGAGQPAARCSADTLENSL